MNKLNHVMLVVLIIMVVPCIYSWDASDLNRAKLHDEYDVYQALWSRHIVVAEAKVGDVKKIHNTIFFPKESIKEQHFIETAHVHIHDKIGEGIYFHRK